MKWLFSGCLSWVLAAALVAGGVIYLVNNLGKDAQQFLAPGSHSFTVEKSKGKGEKAVDVALWHDYQTNFEGKYYSEGRKLAGAEFSLRREDGKKLPLQLANYSSSEQIGSTSRVLIGSTSLLPGKYTITVSGITNPTVFSLVVGSGKVVTIIIFVIALVIAAVLVFGGLALMILGIVRLSRGKKAAALS